jgi:hypothetical protein
MRIYYFEECGGTLQVLFLNRRVHKINFVCHLCLLSIKNYALFLPTRMKELVLLESLLRYGAGRNPSSFLNDVFYGPILSDKKE